MRPGRKTFMRIVVIAMVVGGAAIAARMSGLWHWRLPIRPVSLAGAVLRYDRDPKKQSPIANTKITATGGLTEVNAKSDSSGLFQLSLRPGVPPGQPLSLRFEHAEYKPVELTDVRGDQLYVVRMEPLVAEPGGTPKHPDGAKPVQIKDVRVRYSLKNQTTINVGSIAKQFEVVNTGNVPCRGHRPCSPDGKWKAATGSLSLDAQDGNEFRNVRVSCISGPCPFTRIDPGDLSRPSRYIRISVLNWSDTAGFLVEAEVTRTMVTDLVRRSYPFAIGQTMSFALPGTAEGPSIEADLNGEEIVFPLGPHLILSWASCTVEIAANQTKIYRCELKPGYQFVQ
jgi:hypothetical protein